jgi:hypothetical protein
VSRSFKTLEGIAVELYVSCSLNELESEKPKYFYPNYADAVSNRMPGAGDPPRVWFVSDGVPIFSSLTPVGDGCYYLEGPVHIDEVKSYGQPHGRG